MSHFGQIGVMQTAHAKRFLSGIGRRAMARATEIITMTMRALHRQKSYWHACRNALKTIGLQRLLENAQTFEITGVFHRLTTCNVRLLKRLT
jgi:hypothetical protein